MPVLASKRYGIENRIEPEVGDSNTAAVDTVRAT
jgi:hypothetical protein